MLKGEDYEDMSLLDWSRDKAKKCEALKPCLDNNDPQRISNKEHDMKRRRFL